jgi:hypothetical protein
MATLTGCFPVGKAGAATIIGAAVLINTAADDLAVGKVGGFYSGVAEKFLCCGTHRAATLSIIRNAYISLGKTLIFHSLAGGEYTCLRAYIPKMGDS